MMLLLFSFPQPKEVIVEDPTPRPFVPKRLSLIEARNLPTPRVSLGVSNNPIVLDDDGDDEVEEVIPPKPDPKPPKEERPQAQKQKAALFNQKVSHCLCYFLLIPT